jgi:hypothetical protein
MTLEYMLLNPDSEKHEITNKAVKYEVESRQRKANRRILICLLLLLYMIVANIAYNLWNARKDTSICKLLTANVIYDLWKGVKVTSTQVGTVVGILHGKERSCALINHELVYEGDITNGVKIVRIDKHKVEFEKNGERWTQKVLANPNLAWKTTKQLTR